MDDSCERLDGGFFFAEELLADFGAWAVGSDYCCADVFFVVGEVGGDCSVVVVVC